MLEHGAVVDVDGRHGALEAPLLAEPLHEVDFIPYFSDIDVEYEEGESRLVELHDGSKILLHKLEQDYDPSNRIHALEVLHEAARRGEVLTGIIYLDTSRPTFTEVLNLCDEPLALLPEERVRPSREVLEQINEEFQRADVALVVGANDVVNPAARSDPSSPIYGMPILNVDQARNVIVLKRSMRPGFAGIENELFHMSQTRMLFGDARESLMKLIEAVKAA